ncbi:MAG: M1 family aminopeptidase [Cryomorphaceae bacterium]
MIQLRIFFLLLLLPIGVSAQYDPLQAPNSFQSDENPYYWKNKMPHAGYWQQDVHYAIKAQLDDVKDRIDGTVLLTYTNNSPDPLHQLVFHLYQNAFDSGSYASDFHHKKNGNGEQPFQHTSVQKITVNAISAEWDQDNTVLFVKPSAPVLPGEKVVIECSFVTQFGSVGGRMKKYKAWGYNHYNVVHWYPRISVYDRKFGWTTDQHLGHEFYGDFGTFDVALTLPAHYILDGTGFLTNRSEVLPPDLMDKLRIEQFNEKPWNEPPTEIIPPSAATKTWKFHVENVHDFAWTADPTYRIGEAIAKLENGHSVTCYALVQEPHASGWQNAAAYAAKIIELYSKDFGAYAYHKMIVADARDGMEYPMLTLDGGRDPNFRSLFAHEIGHNWFFGMVGNNETYRAALDEGFTQFLTAWAMTEIEGDSAGVGTPLFGWDKHFGETRSNRDLSVYYGYYFSAIMRGESPSLSTHSDMFESGRAYGQVYSKTATMLYNLQYVLGDELFLEAMKHYFDQWKFCHPYFEDFRASIIRYTKVDLNWFFDEWLASEETIDYKLVSVRATGEGKYKLTLQRKGMQMPLDIRVTDTKGQTHDFHIPNNYFVKETEATVLPKWYGWGDFNERYEALIELDAGIDFVEIDPSKRLADVYQLDNTSSTALSVELNDFQWEYPTHEYAIEWNPMAWYNAYDGVKLGLEIDGNYWSVYHRLHLKLWINSGFGQQLNTIVADDQFQFNRFNYDFSYSDPMRKVGRGLSYTWSSKWLEGLFKNEFYFTKRLDNKKTSVHFGVGGLYRPFDTDLNYLHYPAFWNADQWNNYTSVSLEHKYRYGQGSTGALHGEIRSPFLGSDYNYSYLNVEAVNENRFSFLNLRTRVFGQFGMGDDWAPESQLFAAGANPEQMMDQALTRSTGYLPTSTYGFGASTGNYQVGGGLGLRGYNNYLLPSINGDSLMRFGNAGHSGMSFSTEIEFDDAVKVLSKWKRMVELKTYLFADAGLININRSNEGLEWSNLRMDAGLGASLEIKRWGRLSSMRPFKLRFDFPLFLNTPPAVEEYLEFRWLVGFQRAF